LEKLEIADKWYERTIVSPELTRLFELHVHPFLRCNIWHIKGRDRDLLIDTGLGVASLKDEIADLIDKPIAAVATHVHYDHVGCLHEFDHRIMHSIESDQMADYQEFGQIETASLPQDYLDYFAQVAPVGDYFITALPHEGYDPNAYAVTSTTPTQRVEQGTIIDLGNKTFEVMHLLGHSPGSIGLWDKQTATLFSGDAVYDGLLLDDLPDSNIAEYIETMKRLRELPVDVVHGGHEPSFGRQRLHEIIDGYLATRDVC
jgi:glyoxylase-like metal-dependent hydrolase (beta-lactamase superfamily II)